MSVQTTSAFPRVAAIRLFLLIAAAAFSCGGFTFYAAVVIPIGSEVFDVTGQGFVTQQVTNVLNVASLVTLAIFAWDGWAARNFRSRWANRSYGCLLLLIAGALIGLIVLHPQLGAMMNREELSVDDAEAFYSLHQIYLWGSTIQWLATLGVLGLVAATYAGSIGRSETAATSAD